MSRCYCCCCASSMDHPPPDELLLAMGADVLERIGRSVDTQHRVGRDAELGARELHLSARILAVAGQ